MNSRGHNKTPQVRLIDKPLSPNKEKLNGVIPNTFSRENILPPIHSAMRAFATKNAVIFMNNLVGLSFNMLLIIKINLQQMQIILHEQQLNINRCSFDFIYSYTNAEQKKNTTTLVGTTTN